MMHRFELHKVTVARGMIRRRLMDKRLEQRRAEGQWVLSIQEERRWLGRLHKELKYQEWEASWLRKPPKKKYHEWEERVGRPPKWKRPR
jgi:hypothetical protein